MSPESEGVASLAPLRGDGSTAPKIRLLIVNWTRRKVGGTEDYLASIIPELHARGYKLAFVSQVDLPADRTPIELPQGTPEWCVASLGQTAILECARSWKPDLIYCHGELNVAFEARLLRLAPGLYFAHNYYGTCISGYKAHKWPVPRPCGRTLGWPCLLNYLPLRCGGRSPITMYRRYRNEQKRLENLKRYSAILTHSEHMRQEYIRHGFSPERVFDFAHEASEPAPWAGQPPALVKIAPQQGVSTQTGPQPKRLLFLGRMEKLKGAQTLIAAAPLVQKRLNAPIEVTFGGDGPEREHWQRIAQRTAAKCPGASFTFPGWLSNEQVFSQLEKTDVMVVPSLWPEPFGRVGIQAGQHGVPVAAFAVGGIPEWLKDGVNGRLAPGNPPTAVGLGDAILGCLDERFAPDLKRGARELASQFSTRMHIERLVDVIYKTVAIFKL